MTPKGQQVKQVAQCDVIAAVFASHKAQGGTAEAFLNAACAKLDKIGTAKS